MIQRWRVFVTEATLEASEAEKSKLRHRSERIVLPILRRRTNLCTVLYGDDSVPSVMRSSPALSITLHHGPLLHQGGTVSEAISW